MKTTFFLSMLAFLLSSGANTVLSQSEDERLTPEQRERIESMRIAYITKEIQLTSKQAQTFWPLYNAMQEEMKELRESNERAGKNPMDMEESEAKAHLNKWFETRERELEIRRNYFEKLSEVLEARQILSLYRAENQFRRQLLRQVRHGDRMQRGGGSEDNLERRDRFREHRGSGQQERKKNE